MYCAIIGDLIKSKELTHRSKVQEDLNILFNDINIKYSDDIISNFTITLGDEFQVLLKDTTNLLKIISEIKGYLYPINIRFGIGFGNIPTNIYKKISIGSDGPAYYNARKALNLIKNNEDSKNQPNRNVYIIYSYYENNSNIDYKYIDTLLNLINSNLSAIAFIRSKWSNKQRATIEFIEKGYTQQKVANKLQISQSSVNRRLDASGYYTYQNCINVSQNYINQIWEYINE